jgi:flagellar L-ring protein precursor FlgH
MVVTRIFGKVGAVLLLMHLSACFGEKVPRVVPAVEYTQSVREGQSENFSFFDVQKKRQQEFIEALEAKEQSDARAALAVPNVTPVKALEPANKRFEDKGYALHKSIPVPESEISQQIAREQEAFLRANQNPGIAPASHAPYINGQMGGNPSLWPDESQGSSLFRDLRAFQPMDVVTITINEAVEGQKRTQTDSQSRFSLLAAISGLFTFLGAGEFAGTWNQNNPALDPENLINAQTNSVYQGIGQTRRLGFLRGKMSAVVLEVLPNGLLRLEGTKIISVDNEEEVMVVSGLARLRDIDSQNQIDSARIANMRIDFYGKGVAGDVTELGWGTRLVRKLWPF